MDPDEPGRHAPGLRWPIHDAEVLALDDGLLGSVGLASWSPAGRPR